MGVLGGLVSAPNYGLPSHAMQMQNQLQALAQNHMQQAAHNQMQQAGSWHHALSQQPTLNNAPIPAVSVAGLQAKVQEKIREAIAQLPMKICAHISIIHFYQDLPGAAMRFVVVFDNGHHIDFPDVDEFPAPEHIARIALECP